MSKKDRASILTSSLQASLASENTAVDRRFAAAEDAMARTGGHLLASSDRTSRLAAAPAAIQASLQQSPPGAGDGVLEVPIDLVDDNPENSRDSYPEDELVELTELVRTQGQLEPAHAMPNPDAPGRWILLSGHKRKRTLIRAGRATIKLLPQPYASGIERYKLSRAYNTHSRESAYDNARSWAKLLNGGHVRSYDELAEQIGVSKSLLSKTLAFNKLPESVLAKVREHPKKFGPAAGQLLSQIAQSSDEERLVSLADAIIEDRITVRQLEAEAARGGQARKERKPKVNSRQYKIREGDAEIGVLKDWDHGRVLLEIKLEDSKRRLALIEILKRELRIENA